jgi:hypothetical protein
MGMILHHREEEEATWSAISWVATCSRTRPVSFFAKTPWRNALRVMSHVMVKDPLVWERFWLHTLNPPYPDDPKLWEKASGWQLDEARQTFGALSRLWFWHPRFHGTRELRDFHCILCHFVVGSSWKPQLSSPVVILFSHLSFSSIHCKMSLQISLLRCSWSLMMFLGTVFVRTFFFLKCSVKINRTVSVIHITILTLTKFSSDFDIVGRSGRLSKSTSSLPPVNRLHHSKTRALDRTSSRHSCFNISKISAAPSPQVWTTISRWLFVRNTYHPFLWRAIDILFQLKHDSSALAKDCKTILQSSNMHLYVAAFATDHTVTRALQCCQSRM